MQLVRRISDVIARLALYALVALLPVFVIPLPYVSLEQSKIMLACTLVLVVIVARVVAMLLGGEVRTPRLLTLGLVLLIPIAYGISTVLSGGASYSIWGTGVEQDTLAASLLWYLAFLSAAVIAARAPVSAIMATRALLLGAVACLALESVHLLAPTLPVVSQMLVTQTANTVGAWYELGIFAGLTLFVATSALATPVARGWWRIVAWVAAALAFGLLVVVNTLVLWIAVALAIAAYLAVDMVTARHIVVRRYYPLVGLCALSVLMALYGSVIHERLPQAISISTTEVRPSWQGTYLIGSQALAEPAHLLFGAGPNTFARAWALHRPTEVNQTPFWNTDFVSGIGTIPTSAITIGLFGMIAWALFALSILCVLGYGAYRGNHQGAPLVEILLIGGGYLLFFFIVYVPGPALGMLLFLLVGLGIGHAASIGYVSHTILAGGKHGVRARAISVAAVVVAVIAVFSCGGMVRVVYAEILINRSIVTYNASGDAGQSVELITRALQMYSQSDRARRAVVELGLIEMQKLVASGTSDAATTQQLKQTIQDAITAGLAAVSINEHNYQNWLELAVLYQQLAGANVEGAYENAQDAYAKLMTENPKNPLPYVGRARLALLRNDTDAALKDLAEAIRLKPDFALAFYVASQIYASQDRGQDALNAARMAAQYASNDPLAWYNLGIITYATGDDVSAIAALSQALSIQPQYADALYVLGLAQYRAGHPDEALKTFRELDVLVPNDSRVKDVLVRLSAGKSPFVEDRNKNAATSTPTQRER